MLAALIALALAAGAMSAFVAGHADLGVAATVFCGVFVQALPFLVLGVVISGLIAAFVSAVVVAEACVGPIKSIYDRARPPMALVATSSSSFPSGHAIAAASTVVAAVIALFPEGRRRYVWGACAALFSLLMGISRAYLAAHWLSDAVAGVLIGTTAALGSAVLVHVIRGRHRRVRVEAERAADVEVVAVGIRPA